MHAHIHTGLHAHTHMQTHTCTCMHSYSRLHECTIRSLIQVKLGMCFPHLYFNDAELVTFRGMGESHIELEKRVGVEQGHISVRARPAWATW